MEQNTQQSIANKTNNIKHKTHSTKQENKHEQEKATTR